MSLDADVFRAILAMDSYNRGYNPGIELSGNSLGTAALLTIDLPTGSQTASFFAQAYSWNGKTIISYRGTDKILPSFTSLEDWSIGDLAGGWVAGAGYAGAPQAELAVEFFKTVAGGDPVNANIELTGHSLGGGLAGFVASLYGKDAAIFDNMPFELAATNAYNLANNYYNGTYPFDIGEDFYNSIYGSGAPWALDSSNITGFAVDGEALQYLRGAQTTAVNYLDPGASGLGSIQLHSQDLQVILLFGEKEVTPTKSDWLESRPYFLKHLYDDDIAIAAGAASVGGKLKEKNDFDSIMRTAIAYSAIDEGTLVFGDTGIRALFDDANELGEALQMPNRSSTLVASASAIGKVLVQFSGQIALGKVEQAQSPETLQGVLALSEDKQTLAVDFAESLWEIGNPGGPTTNIIGRKELTDQVFRHATFFTEPPEDTRTGMMWLWNDATSAVVDRAVFATTDDPLVTTIADRTTESDKVSLFAAGGQNDDITGTKDHDFIFGGMGNDILRGAEGDDLLAGGDGDDRLSGGEGRDFLAGGAGKDTVFYDTDTGGPVSLELKTIPAVDPGLETTLELERDSENVDRIIQVEKVELSDGNDTLDIRQTIDPLGFNVVFDGGETSNFQSKDVLSFIAAESPVYIDYARTNDLTDFVGQSSAPFAVELYSDYSPILQTAQWAWGALIPRSEPSGQGAYNGTGLRFTDFEHVIGSSGDDVMSLWRLSPGGELTEAQRTQLDAARLMDGSGAGGDPGAIAAFNTQRTELAGLITQNRQDVLIEGGAGNDAVIGTETGANRIYGGAGSDILMAGGYTSEIYGGDGNDNLVGGGFASQLYGGEGQDIFGLANNAFVMDATSEDYAMWGSSFRMTGGVQQWWMESGWAYWTPASSMIMAGTPMTSLSAFGALGMTLDVAAMTTFRYGITDSGQLVVQNARSRGGQAVIENYELDIDTGESTGNIVAFRQVKAKSSVSDFQKYVNLALKAGFGVCMTGSDPLVLDLDGDGIELTRGDAGTYFDMDADGFAERTAWIQGGDALLARDLNGNGTIDDIGELFGNADTSGFTHLAALDSDGDGRITAADADFGTLRVWRDANGDGQTDTGELLTLGEAGVAEISLASAAPETGSIRGNDIRAEATFTRTDGTTGAIMDALLEVNQTDSVFLGDGSVSQAAAALPDLKGYGQLADLSVAMTNDETLLNRTAAFAALPETTTWTDLQTAAEGVLFRWAGVENAAATPMGDGAFDQQKLAFLETYMGYELTPRDASGDPFENNLEELIELYTDARDKAAVRLAVQGPLQELFPGVSFDAAGDRFLSANASTLADAYQAAIGLLSADHAAALGEWNENWGPLLAKLGDNLRRSDGVDVKTDYAVQSLVTSLDAAASPLDLEELIQGMGLEGASVGSSASETLSRGTDKGLKVFVGGGGNDTLNGGTGQDVYVYGRNFGQDVINDSESNENGDRIRFAVHNPDDVSITRDGVDLVVSVLGSTDKITVKGQFETPVYSYFGQRMSAQKGVEDIQFADGTIFEAGDIAAAIGLGASGDDVIEGTGTTDELEGLEGDDLLRGGDGGDRYFYSKGDGADTIQDVMTSPLIKTPDTLFLLDGIASSDLQLTREGASNDLTIGFGWGEGDSITIKDQFAYSPLGYGSTLECDSRIEGIFFEGGGWTWTDLQSATIATYTTSGDDMTYGFGTSDRFSASAGNDLLVGFDGGDAYSFGPGSGQDVIHDQSRYAENLFFGLVGADWSGDDVVHFDAGISAEDVTFKRLGEAPDLLVTVAGSDDTLTVEGQFHGMKLDIFGLFGDAWFDRVEEFRFADGTSLSWNEVLDIVTKGGDGDDSLYGALYDDVLDGKAGDDFLSGGDSSDTYLFGRGYGHDVIEDRQLNSFMPTSDAVVFGEGVAASDVVFSRDGRSNDLTISIRDSNDLLTIKDQYVVTETGPFGTQAFDQIERFIWADGTERSWDSIAPEIIATAKTSGEDLIVGTHYGDVLDGGEGNDRLEGGSGADTYIFKRGYGADVIYESMSSLLAGDGDAVAFGDGISQDDIIIERYGDGLRDARLRIAGTDDTLSIEGQFSYSSIVFQEHLVESFDFADGSSWTANDLRQRYILGQQTDGDDVVEGFETDDIIEAGTGNDILRGGDGSDTYRFSSGFGQDVIEESVGMVFYADSDRVEFGQGITAANTILTRNGDDLLLTFAGSTDSLNIVGQFGHSAWFPGWNDIETFTFENGETWTDEDVRLQLIQNSQTAGDDVVTGYYSADILDGGAGNDILRGLGGGDVYIFGKGSGQDVIEENTLATYENQADSVRFLPNVAFSETSFERVGDDLRIVIDGVSDTLTIKDHFSSTGYSAVEFFNFDDGSTLTAQQIAQGVFQAQTTSGDDTIEGTDDSDIIVGGAGDDLLRGGKGDDVYQFELGFGQDVIQENAAGSIGENDQAIFGAGYDSTMVILSRDDNDLIIGFQGMTDQVVIEDQFARGAWFQPWNDIETFVFADGAQWTDADVREMLIEQAQTDDDDLITGYFTDDIIDGGAGNDIMRGLGGGDTYLFGKGSGQDVIEESMEMDWGGSPDTINFLSNVTSAELSFRKTDNDLTITIYGTADSLTVKDHFLSTGYNAVELFRFADGDPLTKAEVDVMAVRSQFTSGNDNISGTAGEDILDGMAGDDVISGKDGNDTYVFGLGYGQDVIDDNGGWGATSADNVFFKSGVASGDILLSRSGYDLVMSVAGTADQLTIKNQFTNVSPTAVNLDRIESFEFASGEIWTAAEVDARVLQASSTDGDDRIEAYNLAEVLDGGAGDDLLIGREGNDVYVFGLGYGQDVIDDNGGWGATSADNVLFKSGMASGDILLSRSGYDLVMSVAGTADQLTIKNQFTNVSPTAVNLDRIESFEFASGEIWTAAEVDARVLQASSTDGDDRIEAYNLAEVLDGGAGNDLLIGRQGNDVYIFGQGYGHDAVDDDGDYGISSADKVIFNAGVASEDILLSRSGYDLVMSVAGTADQLTIKNQFTNVSPTAVNLDRIESFEFASGEIWTAAEVDARVLQASSTDGDDRIEAYNLAEVLDGGAGDDLLIGRQGNDVYIFGQGYGHDAVDDGGDYGISSADKVIFKAGIASEDILLSRSGYDLVMSVAGTADQLTIKSQFTNVSPTGVNMDRIESFEFASGEVWTAAEVDAALLQASSTDGDDVITGYNLSEYLYGGAGNDSLYGQSGNDTLEGGEGDDYLKGGSGNDEYIFNLGDGEDEIYEESGADKLSFGVGILLDQTIFCRQGKDLHIGFSNNATDSVKITRWTYSSQKVESIAFADGTTLTAAQVDARVVVDPLVLDLDGDGIETISLADSEAYFDIDGTGTALKTGWVGGGDALLSLDINENGAIDGIGELFGDCELGNGFANLASYDGNGDGVINASDDVYSRLLAWVDANEDGATDAGELTTLAESEVESINLTSEGDSSTFVTTGGETREIKDVYFAVDRSEDAGTTGISSSLDDPESVVAGLGEDAGAATATDGDADEDSGVDSLFLSDSEDATGAASGIADAGASDDLDDLDLVAAAEETAGADLSVDSGSNEDADILSACESNEEVACPDSDQDAEQLAACLGTEATQAASSTPQGDSITGDDNQNCALASAA